MKFKKLAVGLTVVMAVNTSTPTIKVLAYEINNNIQKTETVQNINSVMKKFTLESKENFTQYKEQFKISNDLIESVSSNGGQYSSSSPNKAVDDNPNTHWETGKPNSAEFKNEFNITFKDTVSIDKMTYKVRQDSGTKGFLKNYEIYGSNADSGDDFSLITKGTGTQTRDTVVINFDETNVKRIKIKFIEADSNWASMSEVGFYKNDTVMDTIKNLFTDETKSQVSEEYRDINKLKELDSLIKNHPFYNDYKLSIEDAKILLENNKIEATEAKTGKFDLYNNEKYTSLFKMDSTNIETISTNSGHYTSQRIENAIDDNLDTYWETGRGISTDFKNEIEIKFKERVVLNRLVMGAKPNLVGFITEYEIYASNTSEGDTYQLVATAKHNKVSGQVGAKFEPTQFKRLKIKVKSADSNWPTINEISLYKEDVVSDKMDRLFTDENKTMVSEEFNTIDKLEVLELEVKEHPLYNDFKEDINDARILIDSADIIPGTADTKLFDHLENEKYHEKFRVDSSNIKGITNNGGHYAGQGIGLAIDGDVNTYWETSRSNTETWKNEVTIELNEREVIDKIVYGARGDSKGSAHNMEILVSNTNSGDNFELLTVSKYNHTNKLVEANFEPTQVKRVKLRYVGSNQNWATATEIWLYKEDKLSHEVSNIFANKLNTILSEKYDTLEELNELEQKIINHPLKDSLQKVIDEAKEVINGTNETVETIMVLPQDGNMTNHAKNVLKMKRAGQDYLSTGVYVQPGDVIEVFVDTDSDKLPSLVISQNHATYGKWHNSVNLRPGKNTITVPEINTDNYAVDVKPGGAIYLENPYTPEEQGQAPKVRIKGGDKFPLYRQGDNVEEFRKTLTEYKKKLDADNKAGTEEVLDIMEFESDRMLMSLTATGAYNVYVKEAQDPMETAEYWNDTMEEVFKFHGLDKSSSENDPKALKEHIRLMQPHGYMYAAVSHVGVQGDMMEALHRPGDPGWGIIHEIGHRTELSQREYTEVTNNMLSMHMSAYYNDGVPQNRTNYDYIASQAVKDEPIPFDNRGVGDSLGTFWQLEMYNNGYWGKVDSLFRENNITLEKKDAIIALSCEALGEDVTEHFERLGFKASNEVEKEMEARYPKATKKTWYLDNTAYKYAGSGIDANAKPEIKSIGSNGVIGITSNFKSKDLLGYEILKDGKVIGFTRGNSFTDTNYDNNKEAQYTVIAYGKDLGTSKSSDAISSFTPSLKVQEDTLHVGLRAEFNPMDYVKALDKDGNVITESVQISSNVDVNKKGSYEVTYSVTSNNITVEDALTVNVVSNIQYASDEKYSIIQSGWGGIKNDKSPSGGIISVLVDGNETEFKKGIGAHSNSNIVFDVENKGYEYFIAKIGIDKNVRNGNRASVKYKVLIDGVEVFVSEEIKAQMDAQTINIKIPKEAKKVTLITDQSNGSESEDQSVWADAKFIINNIKPTLNIDTKDLVVGQGEMTKAEIIGDFTATDVEDGDLTDKVVITGAEQLNPNRFGEHEITYSVTDSDDNTVTKTKNIRIVSKVDLASDLEWKHASAGWNSVQKDTSVMGNKITLKSKEGDVSFDKGLGTHSHSEIIYDVKGKGYTHFESSIGVDQEVGENQASTVEFKVYADGKEVYTSGVMTEEDNFKNIKVDIEGTKEVKLVLTDGGDGRHRDHGSWANASFIAVDSKPTLQIGEDLYIEKGTMTIDKIIGGFSATDIEDGNITDKVVITGADKINPNRFGEHEITYTVTDLEGNTVTKTKKVVIVSELNYASDIDWKSASSGWLSVTKDKAINTDKKIKLDINGNHKEFDKGLSTASHSEIVYDLEGKDYTRFMSYVGAELANGTQHTTIVAKAYLDGKEVFNSGALNINTPAQLVDLDLTGAKVLKLVIADSGNGTRDDVASWGDAKFMKSNSKPTLQVEDSISTKVGQPIENIIGNFSANDIEDGDLTDKVKVTGHESINFNKPGKYELSYSVTDLDGNTTTKTRTISVVDMRDSKYLTEYDWKSATQSYGKTGKDVSTAGNNIRLTGENGEEIVYHRGIGAHANGTIIYDLSDKNYEYFTSYVGVDRNMYGSVASIEFKVYVDGEKKYDSGLMTSRDPQKFVEVDINGAKELKLVVTDGGNGIGSDHGSFGDTKLHFANSERADITKLEEAIKKAENIQSDNYTEESINNLNIIVNEAKELLNTDLISQTQCDEAIKNIETAISKLESLDKVIAIEDKNLEKDIKRTLGIESRDITLADMHKLTSLTCDSGYVRTLNGLEDAVNLESLNVDYNEVEDISAIKDLKKLKNFSAKENYIMKSDSEVKLENGKFIIEDVVIDSDGERILPKEVVLSPSKNPIKLDLNEVLVGNKVVIDSELIEGESSVEVLYESKSYDYQLYTFAFLKR